MSQSVSEEIIARCLDAGFAMAAVTSAASTANEGAVREWISRGMHGEMLWLEEHVESLVDPARAVRGARSIIVVADRYHHGRRDAPVEAGWGRVARYARGRDYHRVMKRRLHAVCDSLRPSFPSHLFRACVDTVPILEREAAARAGLGGIGKNTLLIEPGRGSWLLLGEILTSLDLSPTAPTANRVDPCGSCTRCIDACPTQAITPWVVDARKCIAYLTIEHRGPIDAALHEAIGEWIFGCDICQEVCPHAHPTRVARRQPLFDEYAEVRPLLDALALMDWNEEDRRRELAGSALKRARLEMLKRNAVIVLGNAMHRTGDERLRARLRLAAESDESALVRETARTVLLRLSP